MTQKYSGNSRFGKLKEAMISGLPGNHATQPLLNGIVAECSERSGAEGDSILRRVGFSPYDGRASECLAGAIGKLR